MITVAIVMNNVEVLQICKKYCISCGYSCLFTANDGIEAVAKLKKASVKPNVLILDVHLSNMDGGALCKFVTTAYKNIYVVMYCACKSQHDLNTLVKVGANAVVCNKEEIFYLQTAIENSAKGLSYYHASFVADENQILIHKNEYKKVTTYIQAAFSGRDIEIFQMLCTTLNKKMFASVLDISESVVDKFFDRMRNKLGCGDMRCLMHYALSNNIAVNMNLFDF
jgi:DNA-binding NarL/FixJ family response regulator